MGGQYQRQCAREVIWRDHTSPRRAWPFRLAPPRYLPRSSANYSREPPPIAGGRKAAVCNRDAKLDAQVPVADLALVADRPAAGRAACGCVDPRIMAALLRLPARQRQVVALRLVLDLDTELGIAPGTVQAITDHCPGDGRAAWFGQ